MPDDLPRREFLKSVPAAAFVIARTARGTLDPHATAPASPVTPTAPPTGPAVILRPFDYSGVTLLESRWRDQLLAGRDYYFAVPDDDILHGYRVAAHQPAPGSTLGGWCRVNSDEIFGQLLSGMVRIGHAMHDEPMREKARTLMRGWAATVRGGDYRMGTYGYDKLVCGLVDLALYAGESDAISLLESVTDWTSRTFSRERSLRDPGDPTTYYGRPHEWYTLSENLYRAYQLTGNPKFSRFAEVWLYHPYWNKFADTDDPADAQGAHAYSHVNTFSSAAMTYAVTGDAAYLRMARNFYDWLQRTQCYATGGYGPTERLVTPDGSLGRSLETRSDTFETGCGSWAGFKLSRYLMQFTGESRYGDWAERVLYNGVGAGLRPAAGGMVCYYSDYRVGDAMKTRYWDAWPCCSGTYIQDIADYHNSIYYDGADGLYVNLYVPSTLDWPRAGRVVHVRQETRYPDDDTSTLTFTMDRDDEFALHFRVPSWTRDASCRVNGAPVSGTFISGRWASVTRRWRSGDRVEIRIPLVMRMEPIDRQHPNRVAVVRGPVVLVLDGDWHDPHFRLPDDDADLARWLVADDGAFRVEPPDGSRVMPRFRPFYVAGAEYPYMMYFDRDTLPFRLW